MKKITFVLFFIAGPLFTCAQSLTADFTISSVACREQSLNVINTSSGATTSEWDFCLKDIETLTANQQLLTITGLNGGYGYKLVEDNGEWFGFVTSENNHTLYRLDFGNSRVNTPVITNLGNPGGLLVYPEGIEVVRNNGNWFAFIGSFNINQGIVRLAFGPSLTNSPTAQNIGNFGFSTRFRGLKAVKKGTDNILVLGGYNLNSIIRINFRDSFDNSVTASDIVDSGALTGFGNPLGMDVATNLRGDLIMLVTSYNGNTISQLNFGADILSAPSVEGTYAFPQVAKPYFIKVIQEGNFFYAVVSNESLSVAVLNFHDLDPGNPPELVSYPSLPVAGGIETFRSGGKTYVQTLGTTNTSMRLLTFESTCDCSIPSFAGENPPLIKYSSAGSKMVELRTFNGADMSSKAAEVIVSSDLSPDLSFTSSNMCVNRDVDFVVQNMSGDLTAYEWNFGDLTQTSDPTPAHQYADAGTYSVWLKATAANGCENIYGTDVTIYPQPVSDFSLPGGLLCTNNQFLFPTTTPDLYNGNLSYQWLVDNTPAGVNRDLEYTFNTTGPKDIKLITAIPGCSNEITKTTSAVEAGPVVDFSYTGICEDETFSFQSLVADPVDGYLWDFGNSQTSTNPNPDQVFSTSGDYAVSLTATNAIGCQNKETKTIAVHGKPAVSFVADGPPNTCSDASVRFVDQTTAPPGEEIASWLWDFHDPKATGTDDRKDPEHIFADAGSYPVTLSATTNFGCADIFQNDISIYQSPLADYLATPACDDVAVNFSATGTDVDAWYWEIGTSYYTTAAPVHTFRSSGDYPLFLEVTGVNGCLSSVRKVIHVPAPLIPDFMSVKNCVGQEAVLTDITTGADAVVSREWTLSSGETFTGSPLKHVFGTRGNEPITLKVTAESGCTYLVSKTVDVLPPPVAGFSADPASGAYPLDVRFINTSTNATEYLWKFNDNDTSHEETPLHTFTGPGSYEVELTALNQAECEDTFSGSITTVSPLPDADIELITLAPNADGSMKLIVTIHNKGNTVLKDLPVLLNFDGAVKLQQVVEEAIPPASMHNYVFNSGIASLATVRYLCASIDVPGDVHPDGNRMCREIDNTLFVFAAFPNPTSGLLTLEWIAAAKGDVRVSITDVLGRSVINLLSAGAEGLNSRVLDLSGLEEGIYNLVVDDGEIKKSQRIAVSARP